MIKGVIALNKLEFLEILKDYLKKDFSEDEVSDILRDYEEYFVDGVIEGKSDMEIIQALGSPKSIANELISEVRNKNEDKLFKRDNLNDKVNIFKIRTKENYNKGKKYISNKLTPNLEDKGHKRNRKLIQIVLFILSLFLIIPSFVTIGILVCLGIALVGSVIIYLGIMTITFPFLAVTPEITGLSIFASMVFIGGEILAWQIYLFIVVLCKKILKGYINWLKTRNIYINASKKKEEYEKKELDDIDDLIPNYHNKEDNEEGDERYE